MPKSCNSYKFIITASGTGVNSISCDGFTTRSEYSSEGAFKESCELTPAQIAAVPNLVDALLINARSVKAIFDADKGAN